MSNVWFTSDTHFGHTNIIKYTLRPFDSIGEMDERIIANWNKVVQPTDDIYHLGDFALVGRNEDKLKQYVRRLNGRIHLILGNHDRHWEKLYKNMLASCQRLDEINVNGQAIILCHYAMKVWNKHSHNSWQLYGHSHGKLPKEPGRLQIDVGVDRWNFTPISFNNVRQEMNRIMKERK